MPETHQYLERGTVQTVIYRGKHGRYVIKTALGEEKMQDHIQRMMESGWAVIESKRLSGQIKVMYRKSGIKN